MNTNSEKEMYGSCLREEVANFNAEYFVWGEELIDKKIILYSKKLKQIPGYEEVKDALEPCGLVIVNVAKKKYLRCVTSIIDTERGNIYLAEANFNSVWGELKRSIELGIRIAKESGAPCPVRNAKEVVVLDYLAREGSNPVIENNALKYKHKELTQEEKQKQSRRQSLLDNPRMFYYFSETGRYYHDKECDEAKKIAADQFRASETIPDDKEICPKCKRLIYFRKATYPNTKQSAICNRIFQNGQVHINKISRYIMEDGMKFHATDLAEMQVQYGEDSWLIKGLGSSKMRLWHNNYVKVSETERYITEGFHKQNVERKNLSSILDYIEGYSWQKHLKHEIEKQVAAEAEPIAEVQADNPSIEENNKQISNEKRVWYRAILDWIHRFWEK